MNLRRYCKGCHNFHKVSQTGSHQFPNRITLPFCVIFLKLLPSLLLNICKYCIILWNKTIYQRFEGYIKFGCRIEFVVLFFIRLIPYFSRSRSRQALIRLIHLIHTSQFILMSRYTCCIFCVCVIVLSPSLCVMVVSPSLDLHLAFGVCV